SPIFLPSAASFMTDIPGLLVIFVCIYMCQRAVAAKADRTAVLWLGVATLVNLTGGTVRQIAWLGALIIVPSTAWLLRERRGMKLAGPVLWLLSLAGVIACRHWFDSQPYSVPEHIIWAPIHPMTPIHLGAQLVKMFLCLLLVLFPVVSAWLPTANRLDRRAWLWFASALAFFISLTILAFAVGRIETWTMPWLMFLMAEQSTVIPGVLGLSSKAMTLWIQIAISLAVIGSAILAGQQIAMQRATRPRRSDLNALSWNTITWILVPYSISYVLLLMPRGAFDRIQDRYLIGLVPTAIVFLLRLYQEQIAKKLPAISWIALTLFALYSIAGTHDFFAESRAQVRALNMVVSSGVPRTSVQAGFPADGWVQIQNGGHINEPRLRIPAGAYNPYIPYVTLPDVCVDGFTRFTPIIAPKYFVVFPWLKNSLGLPPAWCFAPSKYPSVQYRTWLPPFEETLSVLQLNNHR
ncbi:MAG: hypothetical protein ABI164_04550, partial [Acidobacteriaceae bacterium]